MASGVSWELREYHETFRFEWETAKLSASCLDWQAHLSFIDELTSCGELRMKQELVYQASTHVALECPPYHNLHIVLTVKSVHGPL